MARANLQVFRNLRIQKPGVFLKEPKPGFNLLSQDDSFDITKRLGSSVVTFEETDQGTDMLSFTIKHGAQAEMETLAIGTRVQFEGGYNIERSDVKTKKIFFSGFVSERQPKFPDNGLLELGIVAEDGLFLMSRNKPGAIAYPSKKIEDPLHKRTFHFAEEISITDIVKGIAREYSIPFDENQVDIEPERDLIFTQANPVTQLAEETDLEFLSRILTGKGKVTKKKDEGKQLINARARMFMEWDVEKEQSRLNVIPESKLTTGKHISDITFTYHSDGGKLVKVDDFDPTNDAFFSKLIMKNVQIKENPDRANQEIQRNQDVGPVAKAKNRGSQIVEEIADPTFMEEYIVNEPKVIEDIRSGILPEGTLQLILAGKRNWDSFKHYFIRREQIWESVSTRMTAKIEEAETPPGKGTETSEDENVIGKASGGKGSKGTSRSLRRRQKSRVRQYGEEVSFTSHGSIFALCRQSYQLFFPVGYYSGFWYCFKLVHNFGPIYTMNVTVGR